MEEHKDAKRRKTLEIMTEFRTRLQQEKESELERQKEMLLKNFEAELQRLLHQKEEELKKARAETKKVKDDLTLQVRDAERRLAIQSPTIPKEELNRKLANEVVDLRGIKRRLEEALGDVMDSDKRKANEIRILHEQHVTELLQLKKEAEGDIRKLLGELKAKDRIIRQLKRELCVFNDKKDSSFKHICRHQDKVQPEFKDDNSKNSEIYHSTSDDSKESSLNSIFVLNKKNPYKRKYVSSSAQNSDIEEKHSINTNSDVRPKERKILKTSQVPEIMYKRLYKEHLELQRSFALLRQLVTDNKEGQGKNKNVVKLADENQKLGHITLHLKNRIQKLRRELKESHDQNELLEFCVLELENQGKSPSVPKLVERGMNTETPGDQSSVISDRLEFETLVASHSFLELNEEQVAEIKKKLKHIYDTQNLSIDHQSILIKTVSYIQSTYHTICSLQNAMANMTKDLQEMKEQKCDNMVQNYQQCRKQLEDTKIRLLDVTEQLATVQKREATLCHLEQINHKFRDHLQVVLQDFHVLLSGSAEMQEENDIQILKEKIHHLYKIEKEVVAQSQRAGTLQASPNPLLSEIGEGIICKFTKPTEKLIYPSDNVQLKSSDNECIVQEKLNRQQLLTEKLEKQKTELLKNCNELSSKLTEYESVKYDLTQKISNLEKSEQDLVEKNLKLYIDYVSAKEEVQKLLIELENRQELSSETSQEVRKTSSHQCTEVERTLNEETDPPGVITSEDEGLGEESRRGDSTGPSSLADLQESEEDLLNRTSDFESEIIDDHKSALEISKSSLRDIGLSKHELFDECTKIKSGWKKEIEELRDKEKDLLNQLQCAHNSISELQENVRVKEEQVRKLLVENCKHSNDKNLEITITNMQKDLVDFQERLALSEHSRNSLKEQVLELEEAENDARLEGQKLQEKLIVAVEKQNELQNELDNYKKHFSDPFNGSKYQDTTKTELHSQITYMECLIHKYEDHIRELETSKSELHQRVFCLEQLLSSAEALTSTICSQSCESEKNFEKQKFNGKSNSSLQIKLNEKSPYVEKTSFSYKDLSSQNIPNTKNSHLHSLLFKTVSTQTDCGLQLCDLFLLQKTSSSPVNSNSIQHELLQRLNVLEKEDQTLREQLHQMDGMNLALWKKLHSLEANVGKCMKEYISEFSYAKLDQADEYNKMLTDYGIEIKRNDCNSNVNQKQLVSENVESLNNDYHIVQRILCLENSEQKLKDRLLQLEHINHEFEKELEIRENLYQEKEIQNKKWLKIQNDLQETIRNLENEKSCLLNKIAMLEEEKSQLHKNINNLQLEFETLKNNHDATLKEFEIKQQKTLDQLQMKQENFNSLDTKQLQKITGLQQQQSLVNTVPKVLEINVEKYDILTYELDLLKKDHHILKENSNQNKKEIEIMTKYFEEQLTTLINIQKSEEEKLRNEINHLVAKEKEYNSKIIEMLQKQTVLESELISKESELEQTRKEFQNQMKLLEEEHHLVEAELKWKMKEMEENAAFAVKALKEEKMRLENDLQADIEDLHTKEEAYKSHITELETCVEHLRNEVNQITDTNNSKCDDEKLGINSENVLFLQKIEELQKNEKQMKEKLIEMEKKEEAYKETLEHADKIIVTLEQNYNEKIEELESSERSLKLRVSQLEEIENRLRCTLHNEKRTSEIRKSSDLIEELIESEIREATMREHIKKLQSNERILLQKLEDMDKSRRYLQEELGDHDEMIRTIEKLQQEQEILKKELLTVQHSETALQETLQQADEILIQRENELRQNIINVEEERKGLEETVFQLRKQVKELESKIEKSQYEKLSSIGEQLYETNVSSDSEEEFQQQEESYLNVNTENVSDVQRIKDLEKTGNELRQEITHLKQSLSAANAHLIDLDSINRSQHEMVSHLENEKSLLQKQLENLEIRYKELETEFKKQENEKTSIEKRVNKLQEQQKWWEGLKNTNSQLQKQISLLKNQLIYLQNTHLIPSSISKELEVENQLQNEYSLKEETDMLTNKESGINIKTEFDDSVSSTEECNNFSDKFRVLSLIEICQKVLDRKNMSAYSSEIVNNINNADNRIEAVHNDEINMQVETFSELYNEFHQLEMKKHSPSWSDVPGIVSLDDLTTGLEAQLQLEQCVMRAVAAMEREMQLKKASEIESVTADCMNESDDNNQIITKVESSIETCETNEFSFNDSANHSEELNPKSETISAETDKTLKQTVISVKPLPPSNFRILRQIGNHSLLVGWTIPHEGSEIGGYQIYVEGQLHQKVRSPDRTKTLLPKLNVMQPLNISIYTISTSGHTSEPASIFYPGILQQQQPLSAKELPYVCVTEHCCVLRICTVYNEIQEIPIEKGSHVLVCSVPDADGFCTVKVECQEGKLPFNVLREVGKLPF